MAVPANARRESMLPLPGGRTRPKPEKLSEFAEIVKESPPVLREINSLAPVTIPQSPLANVPSGAKSWVDKENQSLPSPAQAPEKSFREEFADLADISLTI